MSAVFIIATIAAFVAAHRATRAAQRTTDQRLALRAVLESVLDAETGQRGYLLTRDPAYLAPYQAARAVLDARLDHAAALLAATAPAIVPALRPPIEAKLGELEATIAAARRGSVEAALQTMRTDTGRQLMEDVRAQIAAADAALQIAAAREGEAASARDRVATWVAAAAALALLVGAALTLRARAEAQREQALAQLDAMFANIPIGVALLDRELRYVRVNSGFAELGARPAEAYVGQTVPDVFGAVGEHFLPVLERALAGEASLDILSEHVLPISAEPQWYLSGFFPIRVRGEVVIGVGAVSTNITELKRAEAALEATFEQAAVGIAHVTADGGWLRVNRRLCEIVGYTEAELRRGRFQDITEPEDLESDLAQAKAVLAGELSTYTMEKRYIKRDGARVWVRLAVSLVRHADGSPQHFIAVVEDIDARRRAEAELEALNRELEERVAQRTRRLAELNEELEAFSYSVSHDLRAPLRAVSSYCQILQEEHAAGLDEQGRDAVARARAAALRMGRLIDDMLALSRVTRAEVRRDLVDLSTVAALVVDELREHSPRPGVEVAIEPALQVTGDERLLETALRNLFGNAWKFTAHAAAPRIALRSERRDGRQVFLVEDNGAGFDAKYAGRLFAPFQRLHSQSQYEGTGIGLATVKRVITKHGGRVWVERAALQQGVTIAFTLGGGAA
jgi:PAS domain S-box-containing protein